MEELLAKICSEVLELDRVGIHDPFFELGGHSLAATRILSRVAQALLTTLPIGALFDAPTVAKMAEVIHQNGTEPPSA